MRRSGTCMMIGSLFLALSSSAQALKPQTFDPRDPAIWEEKTTNPLAQSNSPCEVFTSSVCRVGKMKNRISSVSVSGGSSSVYRMSTNDAGVEIKAGNAVACRYASCAAVFLCRSAPAGRSAQSAGGSLWSRGLSHLFAETSCVTGKTHH